MVSRKFYVVFLIIICVIIANSNTSCNKDKNLIKISGYVFDPNNNTYVQGANITVSSIKVSSGFYNSNYTDISSATTEANGSFSFEFDQEKSAGYRFYIFKENYFDHTIDVPDADIQPENIYAPAFELYTVSYLKLHVKNSSPYDENDFIAYSYNIDNINCVDCCTNTVFKGYGTSYDSTYKCKTHGSRNVQINWHVTKWTSDVAYSDTVFCTAFDTTFYEILY